jgi:hypothetical protein
MPEHFDAYFEWLAIPSEEQPPNHYRLLGVPLFVDNPSVIEHAADRQMGHLRTFQTGKHSALSQRLLNEVAAAKICLLNPQKKAAYDVQLRAKLQPAQEDASSPERFARELADVVGAAAPRPPAARTANRGPSLWLTGGVAAALLLVGVVAWSLTGRGPTEVTQKAESRERKAESGKPKTLSSRRLRPTVMRMLSTDVSLALSPTQPPLPNPQSLMPKPSAKRRAESRKRKSRGSRRLRPAATHMLMTSVSMAPSL